MPNDLADALLDAPKTETPEPESVVDAVEPKAADDAPEPAAKDEPAAEPAAEKPVAEPKEEKKDESQEVDEIDSDLLMRAEEFGLTEEQARGIGADALSSMASAMDRRFISLGKPQEPEKQPEPQPQPVVQAEPKAEPQPSFEIPKELLDGETVDPVVGNTVKALVSYFDAREKRMEAQTSDVHAFVGQAIERLAQADRANATRTLLADFDNAITSLGDEWTELFGKEKFDSPVPTKQEMLDNRMAVLDTVQALANGYRAAGVDVRSIPMGVLVRRAANATFADKLEAASRKKIASKLKEREGSMLPNSAQRKGRGLSREERALQAIRGVTEKRGAGAADGNDLKDLLLS